MQLDNLNTSEKKILQTALAIYILEVGSQLLDHKEVNTEVMILKCALREAGNLMKKLFPKSKS